MLQTGRAEKVDEKNGVICVDFMFPSWVMILKLSKKCIFSILCWPQQKTFKYITAIYIYASCYALSENGIVYYADLMIWRH